MAPYSTPAWYGPRTPTRSTPLRHLAIGGFAALDSSPPTHNMTFCERRGLWLDLEVRHLRSTFLRANEAQIDADL